MKEDVLRTPAPVTVPGPHPIYDEIEVVQGPLPEDSPPSSPETPAKPGDGENSMEEDDPPHLEQDNSPLSQMEDVTMGDNPSDDGSQMQVD